MKEGSEGLGQTVEERRKGVTEWTTVKKGAGEGN